MTTMADMHWAHVDSVQKQHQILKYVSVFCFVPQPAVQLSTVLLERRAGRLLPGSQCVCARHSVELRRLGSLQHSPTCVLHPLMC